MNIIDLVPVAFVLIALFGVLNYHVLKLPGTIGLVVIALVVSIMVMLVDTLIPGFGFSEVVRSAVRSIDFHETLMQGMLSFLLFAGALHVDLTQLKHRKASITLMATAGVLISTLVVGFGFHYITGTAIGVALVFGALISPTDPVAVMGILKTVKVPISLETKIVGESLFNDGIGVVIFTVLVAIVFPSGDVHLDVSVMGVTLFLIQEVVGGVILGGITGYIAFLLLRHIDEYVLEIMITLALVTGSYSLAHHLHTSGPIAVVVAGLFIGNHGVAFAMSDRTRENVHNFWHLLDEIFNALLFTLIGFEVLALDVKTEHVIVGLLAIPLVLFARFIAVSLPLKFLSISKEFTVGAIPVLVWGGLRGGISVALALSLPLGPERDMILAATYTAVIFSIIIQGTTIGWLIKRVVGK